MNKNVSKIHKWMFIVKREITVCSTIWNILYMAPICGSFVRHFLTFHKLCSKIIEFRSNEICSIFNFNMSPLGNIENSDPRK